MFTAFFYNLLDQISLHIAVGVFAFAGFLGFFD